MRTSLKTFIGVGIASTLMYLSGFLVWLSPLPILWSYKRGGRNAGGTSAIAGLLGLFILYGLVFWITRQFSSGHIGEAILGVAGGHVASTGTSTTIVLGISYYMYYLILGILLGEMEAKETSIVRLLFRCVVVLVVGMGCWMLWYSSGDLLGLTREIEALFIRLMTEVIKEKNPSGEMTVQLAFLQRYVPKIANYFVKLLPAILFDLTLFVVWLNIVISRKFFVKENFFAGLPQLRRYQTPFAFVWVLIGTIFAFLLNVYFLHQEVLKIIALNLFLVFAIIYFFQGLAITVFYSFHWPISPFVRIMFYAVFIFFFQPMSILVMGLGFFDSWFDLRRLSNRAAI